MAGSISVSVSVLLATLRACVRACPRWLEAHHLLIPSILHQHPSITRIIGDNIKNHGWLPSQIGRFFCSGSCLLRAPSTRGGVQNDLGDGHAQLLMYANELCERQVDALRLSKDTEVYYKSSGSCLSGLGTHEVVSWRGRSAAIFG
eukprot:1652839-Amphidinium_carterae.2